MYEGANGERFTIYCSRLDAARTAFRYDDSDGFGAVHWIEGNYGWVVSGPKDKDRLEGRSPAPPTTRSRTARRAPSQGAADQLMSRRGS